VKIEIEKIPVIIKREDGNIHSVEEKTTVKIEIQRDEYYMLDESTKEEIEFQIRKALRE